MESENIFSFCFIISQLYSEPGLVGQSQSEGNHQESIEFALPRNRLSNSCHKLFHAPRKAVLGPKELKRSRANFGVFSSGFV